MRGDSYSLGIYTPKRLTITALLVIFVLIIPSAFPAYFWHGSHIETVFQILESILFYALFFTTAYFVLRCTDHRWRLGGQLLTTIAINLLLVLPVMFLLVYLQEWVLDILQLENVMPMLSRHFTIILSYAMSMVYALVIIFSSYAMGKNKQKNQEMAALREAEQEQRLQMLEQQLSPHFLFNSLNTLLGLIRPDNTIGRQFVTELSNVYRYQLHRQNIVLLSDEIAFVRSYLYLMQIRFGEALIVQWGEMPTHASCLSMSMQMLVENAIKHNALSKNKPLTISIMITEHEGKPFLTIANNLQPKSSAAPSNGIGLSNLNLRCTLQTLPEIIIQKTETAFTVSIPLIQ